MPWVVPEASAMPDPARVRRRLLRWFSRHRRDFFWRDGPAGVPLTPFQVLLVEFLLWKTHAGRSHETIRAVVEGLPSPEAAAEVSVVELERRLRPLGLHRRRAACLAALSRQLLERHGGEVPAEASELLRLTGVGQYAARATACLLAGSRLMPVDANTTRLFGRLHGEEGPAVRTPSPEWDERLAEYVPRRRPERFLWAVMDLAAEHCRARAPRCLACPLRAECRTGQRAA